MSQSLSNVIVHLVFSTKDRRPFLNEKDIREQMHAELGGASKTLNCPPIITGGVEDHIHLLARQSRTIALSDWVKEVEARDLDLDQAEGAGVFDVCMAIRVRSVLGQSVATGQGRQIHPAAGRASQAKGFQDGVS